MAQARRGREGALASPGVLCVAITGASGALYAIRTMAALLERGYDCALLANGTEANHTPQESVAAARLGEMLDVCEAIAELAGTREE